MNSWRIVWLSIIALCICGALLFYFSTYHPHSREDHAAVLLPDGRVLIVGGFYHRWVFDGFANFSWSLASIFSLVQSREYPRNECDLYDPATGGWASGGVVKAEAGINQAASLGNGKVLANYIPRGEEALEGPREAPLYLFDAHTLRWGLNPNPLKDNPKNWTPLQSGQLLCQLGPDFEIFPYGPGPSIDSCPFPCFHPVQLQDGRIFASCGDQSAVMDLKIGVWNVVDPGPLKNHLYPSLILLQNGNVLAAGGSVGDVAVRECAIYDPKKSRWSSASPMKTARDGGSLILLHDGKVLALGGWQGGTACELYDPATGTWTPTDSLDSDRRKFSTTLLQDGRVFIFGGEVQETPLATGEIYDSATGKWTEVR